MVCAITTEYLQQQSGSTKAMLWMPFLGSISLLCVLVLTAVVLYLHHRSNTVAIQCKVFK